MRNFNYIWVINNFIAYLSAPYIRGFTVLHDELIYSDIFVLRSPFNCLRYIKWYSGYGIWYSWKFAQNSRQNMYNFLIFSLQFNFFCCYHCCNYTNLVYGVAAICYQVHWLLWVHPSLFHTATSLLIWYKMFCVRDISYRLIWMEFINMISMYAQSGTHSHFTW